MVLQAPLLADTTALARVCGSNGADDGMVSLARGACLQSLYILPKQARLTSALQLSAV